METRFIGLEGYDRIENVKGKKTNQKRNKKKISTFKKTVRFTKRLSAEISRDIESRKNKKRHAHSAPSQSIIKKKAILTAMACITAAILCGVTVSALGTDPAEADASQIRHDAKAQVVSQAPAIEVSEHNFNQVDSASIENPEIFVDVCYYALTVDGQVVGVTDDGETLQGLLDNYLVEARAAYDDTTTTEFANDVQVNSVSASASQLESAADVFAKAKDKLSVSLFTDWSYEVEMDYDTNVTYDDTKDNSYEEVTKKGETGKTTVNMRLNYVDGNLVDSVVTDTKITKEPVAEEVTKGSKQGEVEYNSEGGSGGTTGNFIWPVPHTHNITSYMEWRWGRMHNGIDIAGGDDYGQPIGASDGGVVTFAGNDGGGYGNYVMIDHGNGYMTVYGHASEVCCTTGQYVNQGDTIALIGSTGNSTGPHLHFEIRLNGEYQDPLNYVS